MEYSLSYLLKMTIEERLLIIESVLLEIETSQYL